MELKELIVSMASLMSVSGYEGYEREKLLSLVSKYFDETNVDRAGNVWLVKKSQKENAPKIMIDTHFDELGMFVTDICEGGFLRVVNIGGIDTGILQASDVIIYAEEKKLFGVVASTPPHLASGDPDELKKFDELLIDTGYSKEELEKYVKIGTPIGFAPKYTDMLNDNIMGKSFDDKACGACAVYALANTPSDRLAGDVYVVLSRGEELFPTSGAVPAAFTIVPDYAMVVDVNLGRVPSTKKEDTVEMRKGPSVSISAVTDIKLTKMLIDSAKKSEIAIQVAAAPSHTGTNAVAVQLVGAGVPVVDVGLPLVSMHTYNEVINLGDAKALSELIKVFVTDSDIAEHFGQEVDLI